MASGLLKAWHLGSLERDPRGPGEPVRPGLSNSRMSLPSHSNSQENCRRQRKFKDKGEIDYASQWWEGINIQRGKNLLAAVLGTSYHMWLFALAIRSV